MGFSAFVKGNHSHMAFLDTPLHVDTAIDVSKCLGTRTCRYNSPKVAVVFVRMGLDFHQISYKSNTTGKGTYTVSLGSFRCHQIESLI